MQSEQRSDKLNTAVGSAEAPDTAGKPEAEAGLWAGQLSGPQISSTLSRGLAVMEMIAAQDQPVGVRPLARALGANPSIVQRLLNTLLAHGYVEQDPDSRKYRMGYRAFTVGRSYLADNSLVGVAVPVMARLAREVEMNFYLGVERNGRAVYLVTQLSHGPFSVRGTPGEEAELHTTAMGKAILAALPPARLERLLATLDLAALTPRSITDLQALRAELETVRRTGIAISDEENIVGVYSAGAVILGHGGEPIAGVSCAGAVGYVDRDAACRAAREAADEIMRRLGSPVVAAALPPPAGPAGTRTGGG